MNHDARLIGQMGSFGSIHHADEFMHCPTCHVRWPCEPFLEARRRADWHTREQRNLVYPEQPGEVAGPRSAPTPTSRSQGKQLGPRLA